MSEFKPTEPVQIEHFTYDPDGVETGYWRNALYLHNKGGLHHVIYASGEKQVLHKGIRIRKYKDEQ